MFNKDRIAAAARVLITAVPRFFQWLHPWIVRFEPWGILLAIAAFGYDYLGRIEERRLRAWTLVTAEGPISGGKIEGVEFLLREGDSLLGARLAGINLGERDLRNISLRQAGLKGANLTQSLLNGANMIDADLRETDLHGAIFDNATLERADLRGARIGSITVSDVISGEIGESSTKKTSFKDTILIDADFSGNRIADTSFQGSLSTNAKLKNTYIVEVDFSYSSLEWAEFCDAKFDNVLFHEAELYRADFSGADLTKTFGLQQEQIGEACGDDTVLPDKLTIPSCKKVSWASCSKP